jgi:hypothetical protein
MANNNNNNNNTDARTNRDWIGVIKKEMNDVSSPLRMLKEKPLSYFDTLTKNYLQDPQRFQVNLRQFPQNFVVMTGPSTKVRILHGLFSVSTDPDSDASTVVGIYGANKVAGAVQALVPPPGSPFAYPVASNSQSWKAPINSGTWSETRTEKR